MSLKIVLKVVLVIFSLNNCLSQAPAAKDWWEVGSFYQIYPRSYKDSNSDGVGDLIGIKNNLNHLKELGINATWLSPIFTSPNADFGYDISNFYDIQPEFGTLSDFDALIIEGKRIGIKIILDFVPNHSSDECEWFKKSVNREKGYEDFYVWHNGIPDPKNSTKRLPPNNWISVFGGSAWTWNAKRQQYYFHQFKDKQPDLNYRSPAVVRQMKDVLRFWLDRGVHGFRIDAVPHIFEIPPDSSGNYKDEPRSGTTNDSTNYGYLQHIYTVDQDETLDTLYQWRQVLDDYKKQHGGDTRILLAETYSPLNIVMKYYGNATHNGAHLPFNFNLISKLNERSTAIDYVGAIANWMDTMPEGRTANWVVGNHDTSRAATKFGTNRIDLFNILVYTLPGAGVTYYGEEIGMTNVPISCQGSNDTASCERNPERTPLQWNDEVSAGFSSNPKPWLPVASNYKEVNIKLQNASNNTHLKIYKQVLSIRNEPALQNGNFMALLVNLNVFITIRTHEKNSTIVGLFNTGSSKESLNFGSYHMIPKNLTAKVTSRSSVYKIGDVLSVKNIRLEPYEALVLKGNLI